MATIYDEMVAATLAAHLKEELQTLEDDAVRGVFLNAVAHAMHEEDFEKFVVACRKSLVALEKKANGCPMRIFEWHQHYKSKFPCN